MTFKEYVDNPLGNYVCIDAHLPGCVFSSMGMDEPVSGTCPPKGDYHCTLIYSKETSKNPIRILSNITSNFKPEYTATIKSFECFDSLPEKGTRDAAKSCIVMKLDCPDIVQIHEYLKCLGLYHSYPEFQPHVTLQYNMQCDEAHYYKDKLNAKLANFEPIEIMLRNYKSAPINKDYV